MISNELMYASGYFTIRFKLSEKSYEPKLIIFDDCPEEIKKRLLKDWERVKSETMERHKKGFISSTDVF